MGLRFYKRVHLAPGLSLNLSRSGPSLSMGVRGAHLTVGATGIRKTVGIPGTGLFYTSHTGLHSGYHSAHSTMPLAEDAQAAATRRAELTFVVIFAVIMVAVLLLVL
jgi:hypothetical protein